VAARTATAVDPESGLVTADFLAHWSNTSDVTTLPVGLGLFEVTGMGSAAVRTNPQAAYHAARRVAAALQQPLDAFDTAVRISGRNFLVVVPGASSRHLARVCDEIGEHLRLASHGYPDVSLAASVATVVTSSRPLPLTDLQLALERNRDAKEEPFVAGETATGDRIVAAPATEPTRTAPALDGRPQWPAGLEQPV
jgi:hypothetical protein